MVARLAWGGFICCLAACAAPRAPVASTVPGNAVPARPVPPPPLPPVAAPGTGIRFRIDPPDSEILLNGHDVGPAARLGSDGALRLDPGLYRVTLRHEGFETWRAEVAVHSGFERLQVQLVKRSESR